MSAAGARLRAFTAAVNQLTAAISSSSGSHAAGSPQLQAMASRLFRDSGVVPAGPLLGRDEQAALAALLGAFQATAAERHARDRQWLELLFPQVAAFCFMLDKLLADEKAVEGWLQRQGLAMLPTMLRLLTGVTAVVKVSSDATYETQAMCCLQSLLDILTECEEDVLRRALPQVAAAVELADLLVLGGAGSRAGSDGGRSHCSCGLHSASCTTFISRVAVLGDPTPTVGGRGHAAELGELLRKLAVLQESAANSLADEQLLARKGGLKLRLLDLALLLAAARRTVQAARSQQGGASASTSAGLVRCADLSAFLGEWDPSAIVPGRVEPHMLLDAASSLAAALDRVMTAPSAGACPRCAPAQQLLVLEAELMCNGEDAIFARAQAAFLGARQQFFGALVGAVTTHQAAWRPWLPAFMQPAVKTVSAYCLAGAEELRAGPPGQAAGSGAGSTAAHLALASAVESGLAVVLVLPGGVLEALDQHSGVALEQLLGCCELVLRTQAAHRHRSLMPVGAMVLRALVDHPPACLEALWRAGALPALVVSVAKATPIDDPEAVSALANVLHAALRAPARGEQPWYAASAERQQFVMLLIARIGGRGAAILLANTGNGTGSFRVILEPGADQEVPWLHRLHVAAQQLARAPLLRQQMEAAAPALLPAAEAACSMDQAWRSQSNPRYPDQRMITPNAAPMHLLVALGRELDPLALGLRLPGCYNPACTCLAGASEADMALKRCMGCKIARYCGPECAKQHWKHHKASCKRAAAVRQAGEQQQQA